MAEGVYKVTEMFEKALADYTKAPYAVAVDNESNALFLCLKYEGIEGKEVRIPARTYPSVPCAIIHAGGRVAFVPMAKKTLKGAYNLEGTRTWDAALRFTAGMYLPETFMCLSFTGPYKRLKLGKGGAILTDDYEAYLWFKKARFSGRHECSYMDDIFNMIGWNFYMDPAVAARGLQLMTGFYGKDGPQNLPDLEIEYPDLSKFAVYRR